MAAGAEEVFERVAPTTARAAQQRLRAACLVAAVTMGLVATVCARFPPRVHSER